MGNACVRAYPKSWQMMFWALSKVRIFKTKVMKTPLHEQDKSHEEAAGGHSLSCPEKKRVP